MRKATVAAVLASLAVGLPLLGADASPARKAAAYKPSDETLEVYKVKCQQCHMADGNSPLEPLNFADGVWKHGSTVKEIAGVISEGVPASAMLPFKGQITDAEVQAVARYVRSFDTKPLKAAPKKATKTVKTTKPAGS